jgi:hypothetical protein
MRTCRRPGAVHLVNRAAYLRQSHRERHLLAEGGFRFGSAHRSHHGGGVCRRLASLAAVTRSGRRRGSVRAPRGAPTRRSTTGRRRVTARSPVLLVVVHRGADLRRPVECRGDEVGEHGGGEPDRNEVVIRAERSVGDSASGQVQADAGSNVESNRLSRGLRATARLPRQATGAPDRVLRVCATRGRQRWQRRSVSHGWP